MKLAVYLAGASRELPRVKKYAKVLEESGLVRLTYRWWEAVEKHGVGLDHELTRELQAVHARADLDGLTEAQLVWCLWPDGPSAGVPLEFGYALAISNDWPLRLVVSGEKSSSCIFSALAHYRDTSDLLGLAEVLRVAREMAQANDPRAQVP
jgi:hypothetical protein